MSISVKFSLEGAIVKTLTLDVIPRIEEWIVLPQGNLVVQSIQWSVNVPLQILEPTVILRRLP